nr:serine/threonine-protein kinase [Solimonas marina]
MLFAIVFAALAYGIFADRVQLLEGRVYDVGLRQRVRAPAPQISVVTIDDEALRRYGPWPWPRPLQAQLIDRLHAQGAMLVASTALYLDPDAGGGAKALRALADDLGRSPLTQKIPAEIDAIRTLLDSAAQRDRQLAPIAKHYRESTLARDYKDLISGLTARIQASTRDGTTADATLAASLAADHVILPMRFELGTPQGRPETPMPDYMQRDALAADARTDTHQRSPLPTMARAAQTPIATLGSAALAVGHLTPRPDRDGVVRDEALVVRYDGADYPSMALQIAAHALGLAADAIRIDPGHGIRLGEHLIPTTADLRTYPQFYAVRDGKAPFVIDSAADVLAGKGASDRYRDRIVLLGMAAADTGSRYATPVAAALPTVLLLAHEVSSLLQDDSLQRPAWALWAELGIYALLLAYITTVVPRRHTALTLITTLIIGTALIGAEYALLVGPGLWLQLGAAVLFLICGHLLMAVRRSMRRPRSQAVATTSDAGESERMLGLAFQGQGQLDMAFDKFRRVRPVDDRLLELVYNLALDFERRRQFNKAESAYQFISSHKPNFRDVQEKLPRARKLAETVILGGPGATAHAGGTLVLDAAHKVEKPMLGRYQVERELGKGAMGVVYVGRDPKIGRLVAIKTMALSQEFEPDELAAVKARFFREAETAGRLAHPHIVAIYDAGEDHDLAYIAMEFVKGIDLTRHTRANSLLPLPDALRIVADAAEALDYAHANGIVHRDIKPGNMMLVDETRSVKLMDFGIARITDSSKTKTGMVLGTPSYMSPEQLAGQHVDGRSDLFSLGVSLYQFLTGVLPFQAESMATLMFKIANEPHTPLRTARPGLPAALGTIIDRALQKSPDARYARGTELARDLRALLNALAS